MAIYSDHKARTRNGMSLKRLAQLDFLLLNPLLFLHVYPGKYISDGLQGINSGLTLPKDMNVQVLRYAPVINALVSRELVTARKLRTGTKVILTKHGKIIAAEVQGTLKWAETSQLAALVVSATDGSKEKEIQQRIDEVLTNKQFDALIK
ncbi:hypothetical protein [Bifidobacterium xylocopae]|uniref:hypothetical protein n=1 Tax=Bifidobacterium xylocopae TaxID=2493119 RepID=UPI000FDD4251|nr:hypothetical protein [Bifidobacterium xylocopae]